MIDTVVKGRIGTSFFLLGEIQVNASHPSPVYVSGPPMTKLQ
jgi:hypothetical protein